MANLPELSQFDPVPQIETDTVWKGGLEGPANDQGKALANRTLWLKDQVEGLGTGKQSIDPLLTALAALVTAADKVPYFTGPDTVALTTLTAFIRTLMAAADAAAARVILNAASPEDVAAAVAALVNSSPAQLDTLKELADALGDDANFAATMTAALAGKQPLSGNLTALAGLASAADKLPYFTAANGAALTAISAYIRTLLAAADKEAACSTLGLGGLQVAASSFAALGLTPTTWGGAYKSLELKAVGCGIASPGQGATILTQNAYDAGSGSWNYGAGGVASKLELNTAVLNFDCAASGSGGSAITWTNYLKVLGGNVLAGYSTPPNIAGAYTSHAFKNQNGASAWICGFQNEDVNPLGISIKYTAASPNDANHEFFYGADSTTTRIRIASTGNVQNVTGSYGAISDIEFKQDVEDAGSQWADIKGFRVRKFRLKSDPTGPFYIGLVAQEGEQVSPGLIEETPVFEEVVVEEAKTELVPALRQKTVKQTIDIPTTEFVDGRWVVSIVPTDVDVPLFEVQPLFTEDGVPIMEEVEPEQPEEKGADGSITRPYKPAITRQKTARLPVMEEWQQEVVTPAKTERRPSGKTVKSVKYSILYMKCVKALQEAMQRIEDLEAKVNAQNGA